MCRTRAANAASCVQRGLLRRAKVACLPAAYSCCVLLCLDACPTSSTRCRRPLPLPRAFCSLPSILLLLRTPCRTNHAGISLRCSGTAPRDRKVPARCGAVVCRPCLPPPPPSYVLRRVRYTPATHTARRWSRAPPPPPLPLHNTPPPPHKTPRVLLILSVMHISLMLCRPQPLAPPALSIPSAPRALYSSPSTSRPPSCAALPCSTSAAAEAF
jgi:hypothetical protein